MPCRYHIQCDCPYIVPKAPLKNGDVQRINNGGGYVAAPTFTSEGIETVSYSHVAEVVCCRSARRRRVDANNVVPGENGAATVTETVGGAELYLRNVRDMVISADLQTDTVTVTIEVA